MQSMLIGAIIALLIIWIIRSTISKLKNFQKLKKLGIPTRPINVWLGGHLFDVLANNGVSYHKLLLSQLGTVSGFYFSGLPIIMVANYEIIREICIRRSSDFANRCMYFSDMLPEPEEFLQLSLIGIKDSKWKTHRSAISPSFTESKLDQLRPMMIERVYEMLNIIREESNKVQEVSGLFKRLTLDIIGTCGFGVATNCQRDRNNSLLQASEQLFNSHKTLFLYFPSLVFESLRRPVRQTMLFYFWIKAKLFNKLDHYSFMVNVCRTILHQRARQTGETSNRDLLHMMIQNRSEPIGKSNDSACPYSGKRVLDEKSIVSNMVLFYEAGFETSSTALTFMAHLLTTFPANQRRMRAEVLRVLYRNQLLTTDDSLSDDLTDFELCNASFHYDRKQLQRKLTLSVLRQMHWLDCFIRESLRMYPPVWNFVNRESQPNATFFVPELNRTITCQGQFQINFPVIHIHYDPNYWRHPLCFRPQRFSTLISDRSLTAAESAEQQLELDPFSLKDDPSFHFSDSQTQSHDILPEPLDSGDDDDVDAKNVNDQQAGTTDKSDGDQPLLEMSADDDDSSNTSVTKSLLKRIDSAHYMPFGIGPRNCVGMRFALLEIKLALCMMLLEFELTPDSTKSPKPKPGHLDIEFKSITIASKEEIVAKFKPNPLIQCDLN